MAKGKPNIPEVDAYGTYFLAIPAKGTAKDCITEMLPLIFGWPFFSKKNTEQPCPAHQDLSKAFYTVDRRKFAI
jgi:thiaminase